jgi:peptidyl-Lys metalloendopeptidase
MALTGGAALKRFSSCQCICIIRLLHYGIKHYHLVCYSSGLPTHQTLVTNHIPLSMFSNTLHITSIALLLSATTTYAAPSLSLHLTGPQTVEGVENLKVIATVNNTGDETLKLLNDPRGPLNQMPADTFTISGNAGQQPSFVGIKVKYVPSQAAIIGKDDAFTVLEPGQSVNVEHDRKFRLFWGVFTRSLTRYCIQVSKAYDFTTSGSGPYSFEAHKPFYYVHPSNYTVVPIQADATATYKASVSGIWPSLVEAQHITPE